ncbi:MAG: PfkB family carbohydrate kinase, partial [Pseudomonadota bacterium]
MTAQGPLDLIGIGECMVEFRAEPVAGRTDLMRMAWGGDVMNSLVHASRLGLKVGFCSRVGADAFGPWLR